MRPSALPPVLFGLALLAAPLSALCADPTSQPAPPPPKMEKLDEGPDSGITITKPDSGRKITEKKSGGKVTEVKVKSGKTEYVLRPKDPSGTSIPGDRQANEVRGAMWQVGEFDLGQKKAKDKDEKEDSPQPPANPAASSTKK